MQIKTKRGKRNASVIDEQNFLKRLRQSEKTSVSHRSRDVANMSRNDWSNINSMGPLSLAAIVVALFLCVALAHVLTSFRRRKSKLKVNIAVSPDSREMPKKQ